MRFSCRRRSSSDFLAGWDAYKRIYIRAEGNVVDPDRNGGTTSEGQGYAMLRAAWMRDEEAFNRTHRWAEQHLKRADGLYSWLWTPAAGGKIVDANTAADADQEIASPILCRVWPDPRMLVGQRFLVGSTYERSTSATGFPASGNCSLSRGLSIWLFIP